MIRIPNPLRAVGELIPPSYFTTVEIDPAKVKRLDHSSSVGG